jgi:hypothetical protein
MPRLGGAFLGHGADRWLRRLGERSNPTDPAASPTKAIDDS